jgi:hypothetical protein
VTAPALLTENEAAEALRLCPRTLRKARQEGRLTYVLIGRAVRYTMRDLESFIEASRQDGPCRREPTRRTNVRRHSGVIVPFTARN